MTRNIRFGVQLTGNHRGAVQSMRTTEREARRLQTQIRHTGQATDVTNSRFQTWASSLGTLRRVIGPLAGVGGVSMLARMSQQMIASGADIQDAADTAGLGAEQYQELTKGFEDLGNVAESVTAGALRRFNRRFGQARQGTGQARDTLEELNITLEQGTGPALQQAISALAGIDDESDRAAAASDIFGETAGPQLAGALGQGEQALRGVIESLHDTNRILRDELIDSASDTEREFRQLGDTIRMNVMGAVLEANHALRDFDVQWQSLLSVSPATLPGRLALLGGADAPTDDVGELVGLLRDARSELQAMEETGGGGFFDPGAVDQQRELVRQLERRLQITRDLASGTVVPDVRRRSPDRAALPEENFTSARPDMESVDLTGEQANERERRQNELLQERDRLLRQIQTPQEAYGESVARLQRLHGEGLISQEEFNRGLEQAEQQLAETTNATNQHARSLQMTFSSALEDSIIDFENWRDVASSAMEDVQRVMLRMMVTEPLVGSLANAFSGIGAGGGAFQGVGASTPRSFAGGGYTGDAPRSGGLDGMGGFPAILHPRETVIDHTKRGMGDTFHVTMSIDARGADEGAARSLRREAERIKQDTIRAIQDRQRRRGRSRL
ncbi:hypothetical protein [Aquisalimonas asiatica]|uniref:Phage tail tape measure protein, lambda family n=1 Tax=Aquisalimonas asiatica TaxID=406100 RepID=A0A1H8TNF6_9GAMM|nr:hypothetical protein [Aquisalimonas asiatica]SEO92385.1 phage tail tape measure protein, lambda family [Aquisalimonas asiatica]